MEMPKRRALGKGLEELFSTEILDFDAQEEKILKETPIEEIVNIPLDELRANPYQPRKVFDEASLNELANSIKQHGVFQPIIVKKSIKGYEIIAGERRVRASKIANQTTVPAIIRDFDDEKMMEIALLENLQREDLNSIEEAMAYKKILDTKNITVVKLGEIIGKSHSYVSNTVGLLRLPQVVQDMVKNNELSMTHARVLSKMSDEKKILELANRIKDEGMTSKNIEEIARGKDIAKIKKIERTLNSEQREFKYIEDLLCEKLGTKVRAYKKKLEITYNDINDLNRILDILKIEK